MSHLHPERLAALADGEPTAAEATHLSSCSSCAREVAAHRRLLTLARQERDTLSTPLASWESLSESLRGEGLLRETVTRAGGGGASRGGGLRSPWWVQAAAAVVILAGGMHIGRMTMAISGDTTAASQEPANTSFVSNADTTVAFSSRAEAISVLQRAERDYRQAMIYLAGQDTVSRVADDPDIYRARLAALDEMAGVALDAVQQTPQDPLMNRYYLTTLGARDATLRQLGEKLPQNAQLGGF
ncbi:MAG TPA: hypothetical protein VJ650_14815 [Gemmatimonadaceae bacterium]|nr:hypothetical protein [Gemmatimonadaceae bacterium]